MAKKIVWNWEQIDESTKRVKVMGGWLIHTTVTTKNSCATNTIYLHDQDWQWQPVEPYVDPQVVKANLAKDFKD
jgi:hypothetical protein